MKHDQAFFVLDLFGDFAHEFRNGETDSYYTQPLGDFSRHKGQRIERTLSRLADVLRSLLRTGWSCHWDGSFFHLECPRPMADARRELQGAGGAAAEWFSHGSEPDLSWLHGVSDDFDDMDVSVDFDHSNLTVDVDDPFLFVSPDDPYLPELPDYLTSSKVQVIVLDDFEFEMEYGGVALECCNYHGPTPPDVVWPDRSFDIATRIADVGKLIRARLERLADLFDRIPEEREPWVWTPTDTSVEYWLPLAPREAIDLFQRWNVPVDRIRIEHVTF